MAEKDLLRWYQTSDVDEAIRTAMRVECPGGEATLMLLELLRERMADGATDTIREVYDVVSDIAGAMEDSIRGGWGCPRSPNRPDDR